MSSFVKRGLGSLSFVLAGSVVVSSGCSATPKGALILAISTDMQTPKDISVISVFITTNGTPKFDYLGRVLPDGTVALPSTLAVVEPDTPDAQVRIRVIGFQEQNARVLRDVLTTVPHEQTSLLRLPLNFLDVGSGTGTIPANLVPLGAAGAPEGDTTFDAQQIASRCDFTKGLTSINGACVSATVVSSTLPAYTPSEVYGDAGLLVNGAPASCFAVETCFPAAMTVANLDSKACTFPLPPGADPSTLNIAFVTPSTGACLPSGGCYVPLVNDPSDGWTVQGSTVTMPQGVCAKLGNGVTLAMSSGTCPTETASEPVCEPTTPAEVLEAGAAPLADGGAAGCDGNYVATCLSNSACGSNSGGLVALTVADNQATLYVPLNGNQIVPLTGTVDPSTCIATIALPASDGGSCGSAGAIVMASLTSGVSFDVPCSNGGSDGSCVQGTFSCTVARGTLDASAGAPLDGGGTGCAGGMSLCGTICVDEQSDPNNCGACGLACPGGASCAQGICAELVDAGEPSLDATRFAGADATTTTCPSGITMCSSTCVNEQTDPNNCGTCGNVCPSGYSCVSGVCTVPATQDAGSLDASVAVCTPGQTQCSGNAAMETCGSSGQWGSATACATSDPNATVTCGGSGQCVSTCNGGFTNCAGVCANEQTDPNNCGGCGTTCPSACVAGVCQSVTAIASGDDELACALLSGGSIQCWGNNLEGELGNGTRTNSSTPGAISGLSGVTTISVGGEFACALLTGGSVQCWGYNNDGELGDGTATGPQTCSGIPCSLTPVVVSGLSGVTAISAGTNAACALLSGGSVECWGYNGIPFNIIVM